jgi:hypothetical protein
MSCSLEEHIAECYRRAEEYKRLRKELRVGKDEILWSTTQRLLFLVRTLRSCTRSPTSCQRDQTGQSDQTDHARLIELVLMPNGPNSMRHGRSNRPRIEYHPRCE